MTDHSSGRLPPVFLEAVFPFPVEFIAAAILHAPDGRYLFQLRDDKAGLPLRNHWALFGGGVDAGEDGRAAVLREIREELAYEARNCEWFHESIYVLPRTRNRVVRKAFYRIDIEAGDVPGMTLCEGADLRLMALDELLRLPNVAPWDLAAVMMHARQGRLFRGE